MIFFKTYIWRVGGWGADRRASLKFVDYTQIHTFIVTQKKLPAAGRNLLSKEEMLLLVKAYLAISCISFSESCLCEEASVMFGGWFVSNSVYIYLGPHGVISCYQS